MASSTMPAAANESQGTVSGDSFIRPHLRKLKPYQPILPFEVISQSNELTFTLFHFFPVFLFVNFID